MATLRIKDNTVIDRSLVTGGDIALTDAGHIATGDNGLDLQSVLDSIENASGWTPVFASGEDSGKNLIQITDWTGGKDPKPAIGYLFPAGLTDDKSLATDFKGQRGIDGVIGHNGWTPVLSLIEDAERRVLQITDWVGGTEAKPEIGDYVSANGTTTVLADAIDIRGTTGVRGLPGVQGPPGDVTNVNAEHGWSPEFTTEMDGSRVVLKLINWVDGTGEPPVSPAVDSYLGNGEYVTEISDATDIRGDTGEKGERGHNGYEAILANEILDNGNVVQKITDWFGGEGPKPTSRQYLGPAGLVDAAADATNIKGDIGLSIMSITAERQANSVTVTLTFTRSDSTTFDTTFDAPRGFDGWSPELANVNRDDGAIVQQVLRWIGGEGTAPAAGSYVAGSGFTAIIADATNIKGTDGSVGPAGPPGAEGSLVGTPDLEFFTWTAANPPVATITIPAATAARYSYLNIEWTITLEGFTALASTRRVASTETDVIGYDYANRAALGSSEHRHSNSGTEVVLHVDFLSNGDMQVSVSSSLILSIVLKDNNGGVGIPAGGTTGQILGKIDGDDYNTQWIDAPTGGGVTPEPPEPDTARIHLGTTATKDISSFDGLGSQTVEIGHRFEADITTMLNEYGVIFIPARYSITSWTNAAAVDENRLTINDFTLTTITINSESYKRYVDNDVFNISDAVLRYNIIITE